MPAVATLFLYPTKTGQWSKLLFHVCNYFLPVNVTFCYHMKRQDTQLSAQCCLHVKSFNCHYVYVTDNRKL